MDSGQYTNGNTTVLDMGLDVWILAKSKEYAFVLQHGDGFWRIWDSPRWKCHGDSYSKCRVTGVLLWIYPIELHKGGKIWWIAGGCHNIQFSYSCMDFGTQANSATTTLAVWATVLVTRIYLGGTYCRTAIFCHRCKWEELRQAICPWKHLPLDSCEGSESSVLSIGLNRAPGGCLTRRQMRDRWGRDTHAPPTCPVHPVASWSGNGPTMSGCLRWWVHHEASL